ncbi:MAG: helix-turn-helix transcriptional regulator [Oscillospiraceae bacterium]|nr:helix-turn-helix transcriptional regulator [Oscillospiraceae bacterium]
MAIGERIHFFRLLRGMTQKYLGQAVGFPEKSADVRLAQYETGTRSPKADLTAALAQVLDVSPQALAVPDIDSYIGLMHTLFALEDNYGLSICETYGEVCLRLNKENSNSAELSEMLSAWQEQSAKLAAGKISKEDYDRWRYNFPKYDTTQPWAKVPSDAMNDAMLKAFADHLKDK